MPIHRNSKALEMEANALPDDKWHTGRTDIRSHTATGTPEHYAYLGTTGLRVRFLGESSDHALLLAFNFCLDANNGEIPDLQVVEDEE